MKYVTFFIYKVLLVGIVVMTFPIQALVGLSILVTTGSPIIYRQRRIGKNGKKFLLYKFRTMVIGAEDLQKKYKSLNEADGPVFKIRNDPRFTRLGKFLSHTGFDELPQLWNVLKGDMALIGPRPLPIEEAKKLKPWQKKRQVDKPGIISPWILEGYHTEPFDIWMKRDITYLKEKSLRGDAHFFVRAALFLIRLFIRELTSLLGFTFS